MVKKRMGFILKNVREMRGYSQQYLASKLNKTQNAIYNWEMGRTSPPAEDVLPICNVLNITPNELFGYEPCRELANYLKARDAINDIDKKIAELEKQKEKLIKNQIAHGQK